MTTPAPAPLWLVLATTVAAILALEALAAAATGGRSAGAMFSWPGILLLAHGGWALRRGAVRARLNRKDVPGEIAERRWVVTIINADIVTRADSPVWFRTYVGAELLLGLGLTITTVIPAVLRMQQG